MSGGFVSIVGAGPGDPELLTVKAAKRLAQADVVVYDALVQPEVLKLAPRARRVYAGKRDRMHSLPQERINELLIDLWREGRRVVRLKGGDPFLFGRGGEEAEALERAGAAWELVPGLSSCLAAPAYAGIPATHRGASSMVTIVTGHECASASVDWRRISPSGTLVVMMGLAAIDKICGRLLALGWSAATPAAVLSRMTWPDEKVVEGELERLPELARRARATAPAVLVVGPVVALRSRLNWREKNAQTFEDSARARSGRVAGRSRSMGLVGAAV